MRRMARTVVAVTAVAAVTVGVPGVAAADLDSALSELDDVRDGLSEVEAHVQQVQGELEEVQHTLGQERAHLHQVEADLDEAEQAARDADNDHAAALSDRLAAIAAADAAAQQLNVARVEQYDLQERLEQRLIATFKNGGSNNMELLVGGIANAAEWHDISRTTRTVNRVVEDDQQLVHEAERLAAVAQQAREDATEAEADARNATHRARRAAEQAEQHRDDVETLTLQQATVVASIEEDMEVRQALLDELEQDEEATRAAIDNLEQEVSRLRSAQLNWSPADTPDVGRAATGDWATRLPSNGRQWAPAIEQAAGRNNIPPELLAAIVWTESNFQQGVVSHAGAIGLSQLMPGTARGLGVDPWDPAQNLDGGARYIRQQLDAFGRVDLALAAYNAGPGKVRRFGGVPSFAETQAYVPRVLNRYQLLVG